MNALKRTVYLRVNKFVVWARLLFSWDAATKNSVTNNELIKG